MFRPCVFVLVFAACGSSDSSQKSSDATLASLDSAVAGPTCDFTGFVIAEETAERDDGLEVLFYTAQTGDAEPLRLTLDFYFSLGATDGPIEFDFTGEDLASCYNCLSARRPCDAAECENQIYLPIAGHLSVSTMGDGGQMFAATLRDVTFAAAVVDTSNQNSTFVQDGPRWCVKELSLSTIVTQL